MQDTKQEAIGSRSQASDTTHRSGRDNERCYALRTFSTLHGLLSPAFSSIYTHLSSHTTVSYALGSRRLFFSFCSALPQLHLLAIRTRCEQDMLRACSGGPCLCDSHCDSQQITPAHTPNPFCVRSELSSVQHTQSHRPFLACNALSPSLFPALSLCAAFFSVRKSIDS